MCSLYHVGVVAAGAACDDTLLYLKLAVLGHLIEKCEVRSALSHLVCSLLGLAQNVCQVLIEIVDLVSIGRMERKRDHGLDGGQIDLHAAVIVSYLCRIQLLERLASVMLLQEGLGVCIGSPDGGQTGGLGGHNVDAVPVVCGHGGYARSDELHYLVLHIAVLVDSTADSQGNVVGSNEGLGLAGQIDGNNARISHIVGLLQELLGQLTAALTDGHGAQCTVTGVGIGAQDHLAAAGKLLTHELVADCDMLGNEKSAVLLGSGETEVVVIIIDGTAYRAERVVTAGEHVGKRELLHAGCSGCLNDAHEGDVMRNHGIELDAELGHILALIVGLHDTVGDGALLCLCRICLHTAELLYLCSLLLGNQLRAVHQIHTAVMQLDHNLPPYALTAHPLGCADLPLASPVYVIPSSLQGIVFVI